MARPYFITRILEENTIIEYLSSLGFEPDEQRGSRYLYKCPLPSHPDDNDPSFFVFDDGGFQNYKCFGCNSSGDVISLCADMNSASLGKAMGLLGSGITIDKGNEIDSTLNDIENYESDLEKIDQLFFLINRSCYDYLKDTDFDPLECVFFDTKIFKVVDESILAMDMKSLAEIYEVIVSQGLPMRYDKLKKLREEELADKVRNET